MAKSRLLYALEGVAELEKKEDEVVEENGDFLVMGQLAVMECERELDGHFGEFSEVANETDDVVNSVERLGGIAAAVENYGICAPMMEAADPDGELVAAGLCCSYEELSVIPEPDVNACQLIFAIESTIEMAADTLDEKMKRFKERHPDKEEKKGMFDKAKDKLAEGKEKLAEGKKSIGDKIKETAQKVADSKIGKAVDEKVESTQGKIINAGIKQGGKLGKEAKLLGHNKTFVAGAMATIAAVFIAAAAVIMTKMVKAFVVWVKSYKSLIEGTISRVKAGGSIDEDKFKNTKVSAYHETDFKRAVKAAEHITSVVNSGKLTELAAEMEGALGASDLKVEKVKAITKKAGDYLKSIASNGDVSAVCGLSVSVGENGFTIGSKSAEVHPSSGTAGSLGWQGGHALNALEDALKLASISEGTGKHVEAAANQCDKIAKQLKAESTKEFDEDEKAAYKQAIRDLREIVAANKTVFQLTSAAVRNICSSAVSVGKAAISAAGGAAPEAAEPKAEEKVETKAEEKKEEK